MSGDRRHIVEGYWDCQYCGKTGIPGRFKSCTGCSHPRDASVKFYTKGIGEDRAITREEFERESAEADRNSRSDSANYTEAAEVTDGSASYFSQEAGDGKERKDESDWYCDFCDSYNPANLTECKFCGAARDMSSGKTYRETQGQVARTYDSHGNLVKERDLAHPKPKVQAQPTPTSGGGGCLRFIIIGIVLLAVFGLVGALLFSPKSKKLEVAGFDWEQTIEIEQYQTVSEDAWELPAGARLSYTDQEISGYSQVIDHYEQVPYTVSEQVLDHYETYTTEVDNGDGTFDVEQHDEPVYRTETRTELRTQPVYVSVPIYDTKYYYDIDKWVHERDVTTSGDDHDPYWGEVELAEATGDNGLGAEREGSRYGTYGVYDSDGDYYTADEDFWNSLEEGQKLEVMVDSNGHITPKKK